MHGLNKGGVYGSALHINETSFRNRYVLSVKPRKEVQTSVRVVTQHQRFLEFAIKMKTGLDCFVS